MYIHVHVFVLFSAKTQKPLIIFLPESSSSYKMYHRGTFETINVERTSVF